MNLIKMLNMEETLSLIILLFTNVYFFYMEKTFYVNYVNNDDRQKYYKRRSLVFNKIFHIVIKLINIFRKKEIEHKLKKNNFSNGNTLIKVFFDIMYFIIFVISIQVAASIILTHYNIVTRAIMSVKMSSYPINILIIGLGVCTGIYGGAEGATTIGLAKMSISQTPQGVKLTPHKLDRLLVMLKCWLLLGVSNSLYYILLRDYNELDFCLNEIFSIISATGSIIFIAERSAKVYSSQKKQILDSNIENDEKN